MKFNNLILLHASNYTVSDISDTVSELRSGIFDSLDEMINVISEEEKFDTTTFEVVDGTTTCNVEINNCINLLYSDIFYDQNKVFDAQDNKQYTQYFRNTITDHIQSDKYFTPNSDSKGTIILQNQTFDLTFLLNRFELYSKLNSLHDLFIKEYVSNTIMSIVVRVGYTFLSNLKLLSKETHFDNWFKENPDKWSDYLLDSVKLISDTTTYDGTTFDLDDLNLSKLNIGIINTLDQYVSYNVSDTITDEEIEYIRNKCNLQFKFVYRYNSSETLQITKKLLIGR